MIEFAKDTDKEQIKKLWHDVFGDSNESIECFLKRYIDCVLLYKQEEKVLGMLSMLPVNAQGKRGRYIYAVATDVKARNMGISTKLIEFAKEYVKNSREIFTVLVPASESLFKFYEKRGYTTISCVKKTNFPKGESNFKIEKISAKELFLLRKDFFGKKFIAWAEDELEYVVNVYGHNVFKLSNDTGYAFAVCDFDGAKLEIKELCCNGVLEKECAAALNNYFNTDECIAKIPTDAGENYAMICPHDYKDFTFNLAID